MASAKDQDRVIAVIETLVASRGIDPQVNSCEVLFVKVDYMAQRELLLIHPFSCCLASFPSELFQPAAQWAVAFPRFMELGNVNLPSLKEMAWEILATMATTDLIQVIYGQLTEKVKMVKKYRAPVTGVRGYYYQFHVRTSLR